MKGNKFLYVIIAYIGILAATVISTIIAFRVGAPEIMFILQIIGIVLNIGQIALYVVHKIKASKGSPSAWIKKLLFIANILWIVLTAANFAFASIGAYLRWDLAVVWVCQMITVLLVYKWWDKIEFRVALHNYSCEDESEAKTGTKTYFAFLIVVVLIQVISVAFPAAIMSTKFRNQSLQYRNIMYEKSADGTEYYVKGVYWGESKKVFIPAEFNGRKVTKILDGALDSQTVWNKLFTSAKEIDEIIFEDTDEHPSNIREIGERAIVGNKITSIAIPSSVESIGREGIVSENLEQVELFAHKGNVYFGTSIVSSSLKKLSLSAASDAVIVFEDEFIKDDLKVTIINDNEDLSDTVKMQEKYNYIRQNYPEIRESLTVENVEKKILVNFETGMADLFIPSRLLDERDNEAELKTSMMDALRTSANEYIKDATFFDYDKIFTDPQTGIRYIFRGWVDERGKDISFDKDTFSVTLTKDITMYARWAKVCSVTYAWGDYYNPISAGEYYDLENDVPRELRYDFIVGEVKNNFLLPTFDEFVRAGYKGLKWYCYDESDQNHYETEKNYFTTESFLDSVSITPVWELDNLTIVTSLEYEDGGANTREELNSTTAEFEYDSTHRLNTTYSLVHTLNTTNRYEVSWTFIPSEDALLFGATEQVGSFKVQYDITKKGSCLLSDVENNFVTFSGKYQDESKALTFSVETQDVVKSGVYSISVKAISANPEREENATRSADDVKVYIDSKYIESDSEDYAQLVKKYEINFDEETFIYDGAPKSIVVRCNQGIEAGEYIGNDETEVNKDNEPYYIVSTHLTIMSDDTPDPNYQPILVSSRYKIVKRPVPIRWQLDKGAYAQSFSTVYNGKEHSVVAVYGENVPEDIKNKYEIELEITSQDKATYCGTYTARIKALPNDRNYVYEWSDGKETCTWEITPRPVNLEWTGTNVTYNKTMKMVFATVTNLQSSNDVCAVESYENNQKIDAGEYTAEALTLSNPNYTLEGATKKTTKWKINKLALKVRWMSDLESETVNGALITKYNAMDQTVYAVPQNPQGTGDDMDVILFTYAGGVEGSALDSETVNFRNAGTYQMSITGISGSAANNYSLDTVSNDPSLTSLRCTWTIDKLKLKKQWTSTDFTTKTYNGNVNTFGLYVTGFAGEDSQLVNASDFETPLNAIPLTVTGNPMGGNLGAYQLSISVISASDYLLDVFASSFANYVLLADETPKTFTINPSVVDIEWYTDENYSTLYTGAFEYSGTRYTLYPRAKATDIFVNMLTEEYDALSLPTYDRTDAGNYTVTITNMGNLNYIASDETKTLNWTILKKTLTVSIDTVNAAKEYDGSVGQVTMRVNGFVSGEIAKLGDLASPDAGFTLTPNAAKRYNVVGSVEDGSYLISMQGVDAATYTLRLSGVNGENLTMKNYQFADSYYDISLVIDPVVAVISWGGASTSYVYTGNYIDQINATVTNKKINAWNLLSGVPQQDSPTVTYKAGYGNVQKDVNEYVTTVSALSDDNYVLGTENLTWNWSITRKALNATWANYTQTYNGSDRIVTLTISGITENDRKANWRTGHLTVSAVSRSDSSVLPATYTINGENLEVSFSAKHADTYDLKVDCNDNNYAETGYSWEKVFTINKKSLTFTWGLSSAYNKYYDGKSHQDAYVASPGQSTLVSGDTVVFEYSHPDEEYKNAGDHHTVVVGVKNKVGNTLYEDYSINSATNKTYIWTINPVTLSTFTWTDYAGFVYRGSSYSVSATAAEVVSGETVTFIYTNHEATNAGNNYTAKIESIDGNINYTLDTESSTLTYNWAIAKKPITVEICSENKNLIYNAASQSVDVLKFSGFLKDDLNTADLNAAVGSIAVDDLRFDYENGVYTIIASCINADHYTVSLTANFQNYVFAENNNANAAFSIAKKTLTVNWNETTSYTYTGGIITLPSPTLLGALGSDTPTFTVSNDSKQNVDSYEATIALIGNNPVNANYVLKDSDKIYRWRITPAELEIVWGDDTPVPYDAKPHSLIATVSGVKSGDLIGSVLSASVNQSGASTQVDADGKVTYSMTNAKEYTCGLSLISDNYVWKNNNEVRILNKNYLINQRPVSFTTANWTLAGSGTYNGSAQRVTATSADCISGDNLSIVYAQNSNEAINAGNYTAVISSLGNANYKLAEGSSNVTSYDWSIAKASISINNESLGTVTYNGASQPFTLSLAGVQKRDMTDATAILAQSVIALNGPTSRDVAFSDNDNKLKITFYATDAGENYSATISKLCDNYEITGNGVVTFSINKKEITTIALQQSEFDYNGNSHTPVVLLDNQILTGIVYNNNSAYTYTASTANENYKIKVTGLSNTNYKLPDSFTGKELAWKINPQTISGVDFKVGNNAVTTPTFTYSDPNAEVIITWKDANVSETFNNKVSVDATGAVITYPTSTSAKVKFTNADVGTNYTLTVAAVTTGNYRMSSTNIHVTVKKKVLTISTQSGSDIVYNGDEKTFNAIQVKKADEGTVITDTSIVEKTGTTATNAGQHQAKVTIKNANYTFMEGNSEVTEKTVEWVILPKTLTVTEASGLVYTGEAQNYLTVTNVVPADMGTGVYTLDGNSQIAAGTGYKAEIRVHSGNYKLAGDDPTYQAYDWSIAKKKVTLKVNGSDYTSSSYSVICQYNPSGVTLDVKHYYDSAELNDIATVTGDVVKTDPGDYTANVMLKSNYQYSDGTTSRSVNWKIGKATITVTFTDYADKTYNGKTQAIQYSIMSGNVNCEAYCNIDGTKSAINEGTYAVTINVKDNYADKYVISGGNTRDWKIVPNKVTLNVQTTGYTYKYGTDQTVQYSVVGEAGIEESDILAAIKLDGDHTRRNKGNYTVTFAWKEEAANNFTFVKGTGVTSVENNNTAKATWTITPMTIEATMITPQLRKKNANGPSYDEWEAWKFNANYAYNGSEGYEIRLAVAVPREGDTPIMQYDLFKSGSVFVKKVATKTETEWSVANTNYTYDGTFTYSFTNITAYVVDASVINGKSYSSETELRTALCEISGINTILTITYYDGTTNLGSNFPNAISTDATYKVVISVDSTVAEYISVTNASDVTFIRPKKTT